jgi:hypothetical protein
MYQPKGIITMQKTIQINPTHSDQRAVTTPTGGLPVRTNLRAGLAWDDLDDQAKALWEKLTGAVNTAVAGTSGDSSSTAA